MENGRLLRNWRIFVLKVKNFKSCSSEWGGGEDQNTTKNLGGSVISTQFPRGGGGKDQNTTKNLGGSVISTQFPLGGGGGGGGGEDQNTTKNGGRGGGV